MGLWPIARISLDANICCSNLLRKLHANISPGPMAQEVLPPVICFANNLHLVAVTTGLRGLRAPCPVAI